ncbi:hypothetical protein BD410DRAFT_797432, partial [Rickenella mellea]
MPFLWTAIYQAIFRGSFFSYPSINPALRIYMHARIPFVASRFVVTGHRYRHRHRGSALIFAEEESLFMPRTTHPMSAMNDPFVASRRTLAPATQIFGFRHSVSHPLPGGRRFPFPLLCYLTSIFNKKRLSSVFIFISDLPLSLISYLRVSIAAILPSRTISDTICFLLQPPACCCFDSPYPLLLTNPYLLTHSSCAWERWSCI